MSLSVHRLTFYFSVFGISLSKLSHCVHHCTGGVPNCTFLFIRNHREADVSFLRTRQVDRRVEIANDGRRLADEGEEEWAVVAELEPEQEKEDHRHYDIRPDHCWEAICGL